VEAHDGLWSWLGLFFFDLTCPADAEGRRKPGENYRHIFDADHGSYDYLKAYRHLLNTPYRIVTRHAGAGRCLLLPRIDQGGDFTEQIASRLRFVSNTAILEALDMLYLDDSGSTPKLKRGATVKERPGTLRRFVSVMDQFDPTFDLYAMTSSQLVELLPREFDEWVLGPGP
jgi:hypothetical protein